VSLEARRIGYFPTVIHSDRGTEFINTHLLEFSKNSPYELFKGRKMELSFFKPIGNRVSYLILPERNHSKLDQKGLLGTLIGFNDELLSYRILSDDGRLINTKNLKFLDFPTPPSDPADDDLIIMEDDRSTSSDSLSGVDSDSPEETTSKVKPIKYSYLTSDPTSFKKAMQSYQSVEWSKAADEDLDNIEGHNVWEYHHEEPRSFLCTVWIFKTKLLTLSSAKRKKARLCIQGFLQIPGQDYNNTFTPTGKFTSLLIML
ncbi:hypothetical protein VP01_7976g1, partial [Puccinia sorghi]